MKSCNAKKVEQYLKQIKNSLQEQDIFHKVGKLWNEFEMDNRPDNLREYYNSLDETITKCMLSAENSLVFPELEAKFAKQIKILTKIRYFKLLLKRAQGHYVNEEGLAILRIDIGTKNNSRDAIEISLCLKKSWREW